MALRVTVVAAGGRTDDSNVTTVAFTQAKVAPPDAMPRGNLSQAHAATVLTASWMPGQGLMPNASDVAFIRHHLGAAALSMGYFSGARVRTEQHRHRGIQIEHIPF